MSFLGVQPVDIANQAIDALGWPITIGDLQEGTREASVLLRHYSPTLEEISRAAHWNFARRQFGLTLLQDASGQTAGAGTGTPGMGLWLYEYAWPIDCMRAIYIPANGTLTPPVPAGNIAPPAVPVSSAPLLFPAAWTVPVPFQVSQDIVPNVIGVPASWDQFPDLEGTQGQGFSQQTVILTNQPLATMVYTSLVSEPNIWDPLFRQAVVGLLAAKCALAIIKDRKEALAVRPVAIQMAKTALEQARLADGNESNPQSTDHTPDWISGRGTRYGYGINSGWGGSWASWAACPFPDGSVY